MYKVIQLLPSNQYFRGFRDSGFVDSIGEVFSAEIFDVQQKHNLHRLNYVAKGLEERDQKFKVMTLVVTLEGSKDETGLLTDTILDKIAHHRPHLQPMVDEVKASTGSNRKKLERQLGHAYDGGIASRLTSEELLIVCEAMGI